MTGKPEDILNVSDDDFINMMPPVVDPSEPKAEPVIEADDTTGSTDNGEAADKDGDKDADKDDKGNTPDPVSGEDGADGEKPKDGAPAGDGEADDQAGKATDDEATKPKDGVQSEPVKVETDAEKEAAKTASTATAANKTEETPVNYQAEYERLMAPFQANGKPMQVKSTDEIVKLMQLGANYSKKMQDIQPHRKVLKMLETNNLLDEDNISFLIDLHAKNPEAIKKLIKDSGTDPLEIDTSVEPDYVPGAHRVSDAEVNFSSALDEVTSTQEGQELVSDIHRSWDNASKQGLMDNPSMLEILALQRKTGVYARISDEVDRQRTLGTIPATKPFIEAYIQVGDQLEKSGAFQDLVQKTEQGKANLPNGQAQTEGKTPVATTVAAPKTPVTDDAKVNAAAASPATARTAKPLVNPLAMSDEEFMSQIKV